MFRSLITGLFLTALAVPFTCMGQVTTADLIGRITDATGAANALSSGARPDDRRPGVTISVGAQGSQVNNYMVDGMDNNDRAIGTAIVRPSIDALAEIHIQTNLYTAEVGRTAGGVVNLLS